MVNKELERIIEQERERSPETFYDDVGHSVYSRDFLNGGLNSVTNTDWRDGMPSLDAAARHPVIYNQNIEDAKTLDEDIINAVKKSKNWTRSAILMLRKDYREEDGVSSEDFEKSLMIVAEHGYSGEARYHSVPLTQGHAGHSFITEKTVYIPDISRSTQYHQIPGDEFPSGSEIAIPVVNDLTSGVLVVTSPDMRAFSESDIGLLEQYANQVGKTLDKISDINLDELTRFWTRGRFENDYKRMFLRAKNTMLDGDEETNRGFGLVILDGNALKYVNDHNDGHSSGDEYLQAIAQGIRQTIRASDQAYRIGGDEFAILLDSNNAEVDLDRFIEGRLKPTIKELVTELHVKTGISAPYEDPISAGGACIKEFFNMGITPTMSLLRQKADAGVYEDKKTFKEQYGMFTPNGR